MLKIPFKFDFTQYYKVVDYDDELLTEEEAQVLVDQLHEMYTIKKVPKIFTFIKKN